MTGVQTCALPIFGEGVELFFEGGDVDGDAGGFHFGEDGGEGEFKVEVEFEFVDGGEFGNFEDRPT